MRKALCLLQRQNLKSLTKRLNSSALGLKRNCFLVWLQMFHVVSVDQRPLCMSTYTGRKCNDYLWLPQQTTSHVLILQGQRLQGHHWAENWQLWPPLLLIRLFSTTTASWILSLYLWRWCLSCLLSSPLSSYVTVPSWCPPGTKIKQQLKEPQWYLEHAVFSD